MSGAQLPDRMGTRDAQCVFPLAPSPSVAVLSLVAPGCWLGAILSDQVVTNLAEVGHSHRIRTAHAQSSASSRHVDGGARAPSQGEDRGFESRTRYHHSRPRTRGAFSPHRNIAARAGGETYTFDAENRMTQTTSYPTSTAYDYDGQGNLAVRRTSASPRAGAVDDRTVYVGGVYEERTEYGIGINAEATVMYQAFGRTIATRTGTKTTYLLADHLGSTVGSVSADGSEVHQVRYWPYGKVRSGGVGTDKMYTGQQIEANSALGAYFYHARFYSTALGHFLSADSEQGPNRYQYANHAPNTYSDPTGHSAESPGLFEGSGLNMATATDLNACAGDLVSCLSWVGGSTNIGYILAVAIVFGVDPRVLAGTVLNEIQNLGRGDNIGVEGAVLFAAAVKDLAGMGFTDSLRFIGLNPANLGILVAARAADASHVLDRILHNSIGYSQLNAFAVRELEAAYPELKAGSWTERVTRLLTPKWAVLYAGAHLGHISTGLAANGDPITVQNLVVSYRYEGQLHNLDMAAALDTQWRNVQGYVTFKSVVDLAEHLNDRYLGRAIPDAVGN